jgi:hypothetical protein
MNINTELNGIKWQDNLKTKKMNFLKHLNAMYK